MSQSDFCLLMQAVWFVGACSAQGMIATVCLVVSFYWTVMWWIA